MIVCFATLLAVLGSALGQIRKSVTYSSFINPIPSIRTVTTFTPSGIHRIAGGVLLEGSSAFYLETSSTKHKISATDLSLSVDEKNIYISHAGQRYQLEIHRGLACPLGQFVARGGRIAYTIPPVEGVEVELKRAGVVDSVFFDGFVAKEFVQTPFEILVAAADFAETTPLPRDLRMRLMESVNTATNAGFGTLQGSYLNSDSQITYQVYLVAATHSVETEGIPLRYDWVHTSNKVARIIDITAISQFWPEEEKLTDFYNPNSMPSQYDVVSLYQNAGIFRQLKNNNTATFTSFVAAACKA